MKTETYLDGEDEDVLGRVRDKGLYFGFSGIFIFRV